MKSFTGSIHYKWWQDDHKDIKPNHVEILAESAKYRIQELLPKGYVSGQLSDTIEDEEDEVGYTGWWWLMNS